MKALACEAYKATRGDLGDDAENGFRMHMEDVDNRIRKSPNGTKGIENIRHQRNTQTLAGNYVCVLTQDIMVSMSLWQLSISLLYSPFETVVPR